MRKREINPRPGVVVCCCDAGGQILRNDPWAWFREERRRQDRAWARMRSAKKERGEASDAGMDAGDV